MPENYKHHSLNLQQNNKLIYTAISKRNFYFRSQISVFVLNQKQTPINSFLNLDYHLAGAISKDLTRIANNTMIKKCDEIWVFGEISDGVLTEIYFAKKYQKPIHYYTFDDETANFKEISKDEVKLEDISPWMWQWIKDGKNLERWHPRLRFKKTYPIVYTAISKRNFYAEMQISKFCLEKKKVPLNPSMLFTYFFCDIITPRNPVYTANGNILRMSDEVWVFGEISDGVLAEIKMKKEQNLPVKYFKIVKNNPVTFRKILPKSAVFEEKKLEQYRNLL